MARLRHLSMGDWEGLMAEIWFSSDHHFHHANIIKYCNRPFKDVVEMNQRLVEIHNTYVKPPDHWYCLGDVTMKRDNQGLGLQILLEMNGHGRLIMGNHDHYANKWYAVYFEKIMAMQMIDGIRFTHIPIHTSAMSWSTRANVHGHIHDNDAPEPVVRVDKDSQLKVQPYINISLERTNYRPVTLGEIKEMIARKIDEVKNGQSDFVQPREAREGEGTTGS